MKEVTKAGELFENPTRSEATLAVGPQAVLFSYWVCILTI